MLSALALLTAALPRLLMPLLSITGPQYAPFTADLSSPWDAAALLMLISGLAISCWQWFDAHRHDDNQSSHDKSQ